MAYYNETSAGYNELHGEEQLRKLRVIHEYLTTHKLLNPADTILDVGCGTGLSAQVFKNKIVGIDPAKELLKQVPVNAHFETVCGQAEELPFPDKSFDGVICITAIHNCASPEKALEEMKRVGKKVWVITVLKKANKAKELAKMIQNKFSVVAQLDDVHDQIFILLPA